MCDHSYRSCQKILSHCTVFIYDNIKSYKYGLLTNILIYISSLAEVCFCYQLIYGHMTMTKSKCHPVGDNYMYKQLCIFQLLPNKPEVTLHLTTAVYSTKHYFHYWPTGKPLVFFPCISVFPSALSWETLIFLGKKTYTYFPPGPATKFT